MLHVMNNYIFPLKACSGSPHSMFYITSHQVHGYIHDVTCNYSLFTYCVELKLLPHQDGPSRMQCAVESYHDYQDEVMAYLNEHLKQ